MNFPEPLNIAIILAGGTGRRAAQASQVPPTSQESDRAPEAGQLPKQFWPLDGKPLWEHSWLSYARHPAIHKVCLVLPDEYVETIHAHIHRHPAAAQMAPSYVLAGGRERSDSSCQALEFCQQWQDESPRRRIQVLIHDAARPLVNKRMIDDTLQQLCTCNAVVCAIPVQDSLFVRQQNHVARVLDRSQIMQSQTPQSFELQTLRLAFAQHRKRRVQQKYPITDDISMILNYQPSEDIKIVPGEIFNLKLTVAADLEIIKQYYPISKDGMQE